VKQAFQFLISNGRRLRTALTKVVRQLIVASWAQWGRASKALPLFQRRRCGVASGGINGT
jgi:hypothetical protein